MMSVLIARVKMVLSALLILLPVRVRVFAICRRWALCECRSRKLRRRRQSSDP